jgi:MoxR-like ATPase
MEYPAAPELAQSISTRIKAELKKAIIGQDEACDLLLVALLSDGHILLEGVPGTAKTLLVQAFAKALALDFGRIQFTPDLMPGDVIGTNLFNFQTNSFHFIKGPLFTQLLLADEINRTPPKTQAALLQAMQEHAITIDGTTHPLGQHFMVIATQNPIDQQGTYPLPEAQLDRFLFKHILDYPNRDEERRIVTQFGQSVTMPKPADLGVAAVVTPHELEQARRHITAIRLSGEIVDYVVDLVRATRQTQSLQFGASPRAATMLATAARTYAGLAGRDYVIPDDVKYLAVPALRHRVILAPNAEIEGLTTDQVIRSIIDQIAAPR